MSIRNRLPSLRIRSLDSLRSTKHEIQAHGDRRGVLVANLADEILFLAVATYVLDGSVQGFRDKIAEAAELRLDLFRRHAAGEDIWPFNVSNGVHDWMYYCLAAARFDLAMAWAQRIGNVASDEISNAYCLSLKHLLLGPPTVTRQHLATLAQVTPTGERNVYYRFMSELASDAPESTTIQDLVIACDRQHRRETKSDNTFVAGTEQEVLCLWGIGLANLARHRGLVGPITFESELLPADLVGAEKGTGVIL